MATVSQKPNAVVSGLLDYLNETDQSDLLPQVQETLGTIVGKSKKAEKIMVTSTVALTDIQKKLIQNFVIKKIGVHLPLVNTIDTNIIGGFTLHVGDWYVDASLAFALKNLSRSLLS